MSARRAFTRLAPLVLAALASGCAGQLAIVAPPDALPSLASDWYPLRAASLHVTIEEARSRDLTLSEEEPPRRLLEDPQLAREAALLWRELCSKCHGEDGRPPPREGVTPRTWGTLGAKLGFFFGGDRMRRKIYRRIRDGGEPRDGALSEMVAWKDDLAREQIWALVAYVEAL